MSLKKKLISSKSAASSREFTSRNEAQASKPQKRGIKPRLQIQRQPCSREFTSRNKAQAPKSQKRGIKPRLQIQRQPCSREFTSRNKA
ncbi:hypothetical protein CXF89_09820 [Pseudoalteromonas sp. MelDa3]|nr:hypothetical protein CXF89_09820 [Pseudoalteromonas sp. MelDa3]